jgi:lysophospholipase L1-like esterase
MAVSNMLILFALTIGDSPAAAQSDFELYDGDRVIFVGNTFIERDQVYGYLETMLTTRWPDRNITFRNLGWSGDTVWGEARARFGSPEEGFQHLKEHVQTIQPTVLFVAYGANESFEAEAGLPKFEKGLIRLIDMLTAAAGAKPRMVLLAPLPQENFGPPLPDPVRHNDDVKRYSNAIQRVAAEHDCRFIDLYDLLGKGLAGSSGARYTDNGIHLTAYGYWKIATIVEGELGIRHDKCEVKFKQEDRPSGSQGTTVSNIASRRSRVQFEVKHSMLPIPLPPTDATALDAVSVRTQAGLGLGAGRYRLSADGVEIGVFAKGDPAHLRHGPDYEQVERLRQAIIAKNRLYFHRWRPQNETYLFGFRKHEQGQNAAEVPRFDPLVEEKEKLIAELRVPVSHTYELVAQPE